MADSLMIDPTLRSPPTDRSHDAQSPTTPRQTIASVAEAPFPNETASPTTPTRDSCGGLVDQTEAARQSLLLATGQDQTKDPQESLKRDGLHRSPTPRQRSTGEDVEMGEGDDDNAGDEGGSDNESAGSDAERPSKKKKGQRFFCTDFPPCRLSFTRSEHLARHIRKHTGERPFQCHCSRRFSRLDNLRQHAQTVHVNEEIPGDSLAATSTRFQRQIRTDRVRPPNSRSRASTISSAGGPSRGHSRNLSSSSVGSTTSSVGIAEDTRRRPQPLAMASNSSPDTRLSVNTQSYVTNSPGQTQYIYYNQSPTGYSTPTSATFSTGPGSPGFPSSMASPTSTTSRSSFYNGARTGRRLSVPSGVNPFHNPGGSAYPPPVYYNATVSPHTFSQNSSVFASPTNTVFSHGRRESEAELEYRRRTWHPGTYPNYSQRPATSGLSFHQTPDDHHPAMSSQLAASQMTRLPGIESFDHAPPQSARKQSSPSVTESSPGATISSRPSDAGLHQNITTLDIAGGNASSEARRHTAQLQAITQQGHDIQEPNPDAPQSAQPPTTSLPEPPVTPRRNKRQAWYGGPVAHPAPGQTIVVAQRPSPEDSGSSDGVPTPGTSQVTEFHPVIVNANGTVEPYPPGATVSTSEQQKVYYTTNDPKPSSVRTDSGFQPYVYQQGDSPQLYTLQAVPHPRATATYPQQSSNDMGRLEALVAVATSEDRATERS